MSEELGEILINAARSGVKFQVVPATVKSVDKSKHTCICSPIDGGADFLDVRIKKAIDSLESYLVIYPKVDSTVLVGIINNDDGIPFLSMVNEVDEIIHMKPNGKKLIIDDTSLVYEGTNGKKFTLDDDKVVYLGENSMKLTLYKDKLVYENASDKLLEITTSKVDLKGSTITILSDNVKFNTGANGGLIKINDILSSVNAIESDINTLKAIFVAWIVAPNDGGNVLKLAANAAWATNPLTVTTKASIENTKVKH